ncbi:hypothetical protein L9F63_004674, partial [Diploptera punctata]
LLGNSWQTAFCTDLMCITNSYTASRLVSVLARETFLLEDLMIIMNKFVLGHVACTVNLAKMVLIFPPMFWSMSSWGILMIFPFFYASIALYIVKFIVDFLYIRRLGDVVLYGYN